MNSKKMEKTNRIMPEIRFPKFKNNETWKEKKMFEILFEHGNKSSGKEEVYSVSVHKGLINQIEHLGRSFASANTEKYNRVSSGDLVYTKSPTGDFPYGIIKQNKHNKDVIVSPLYGVFTPETKALGLILDAYFESDQNTYNYLSSIVQKGAKNTINIKNETFLSKSLYVPIDKAEQQKIADFLSSLDEVIAAHIDKFKTLKCYKKGLLQNLFPQENQKVPNFRFSEFVNSREWKEEKLVNVANYENGKAHEQDILESGQFIVVNSKFVSTEGKVKKYTNSGNCIAKINEILMVLSDVPNGKAIGKCFLVDNDNLYTVNQRVCKISPFDVDARFLYYTLDKASYFLNFDDGVKQTNLKNEDVQDFPFLLPKNLKEQEKIARCLEAIDGLITAQKEKIEQLKVHKKGLMQGLFPKVTN